MNKTNFTVASLIEALQKLPQDLPVLITAYESGYEDFQSPIIKSLSHHPENPYYDGQFQEGEKHEDELLSVVVLEREVRHE